MRTQEKLRQKLSTSKMLEGNAKFSSSIKRWKVNINAIEDFIDYMEEESSDYFEK